jgi:hypothetical protein
MTPGDEQPGSGPHPGWPTAPQPPGHLAPSPPDARPGGGPGRVGIAVIAATAVLAAAVVTGVFMLRDDGGNGGGGDGGDGNAGGGGGGEAATPAAEATGSDPDDPRQGVLERPDPVVSPDWQVQTIENRHNAFDVPPGWEVGSEDHMVGYEDGRAGSGTAGGALVMMSAVSTYRDGWCPEAEYGDSWRAAAGTKGGQGATGTEEAARHEARTWALAAYDQDQRGTLEVSGPEPFESGHGITGHTATATVTGVPDDPGNECGTFDGTVVTVSYLDLNHDLATWVLVADRGFDGALDDETIELMMNSLRPYPQE